MSEKLGIKCWVNPIQNIYEEILKTDKESFEDEISDVAKSCIHATLRTCLGLYNAHRFKSTLISTTNHTELCLGFSTYLDISYAGIHTLIGDLTKIESLSLSPRFTVKKLTRKPFIAFDNPLNPSSGDLSREEIVCNLRLLSVNCLEPIYARFSNVFVTNTWRPRGIGSPTSQHPRGQAADMQFRGVPKSEYFKIAQVIKDLVPFDQLLLEYKTTGTGLPWIHISFNKAGNRKQVLTFLNNRRYAQGLVDLADR
jgi:hypothetical protein